MSITPQGYQVGTLDEVDAASRARHITLKGIDYRIGGSYSAGGTGGSSGTGGFTREGSFRWASPEKVCLIRRVRFASAVYATPTAGVCQTKLLFVRSWEAQDSGGTQIAMPVGGTATVAMNNKRDSTNPTSLLYDFRVSTITGASQTIEDNNPLSLVVTSQTASLGFKRWVACPLTSLWEQVHNDTRFPLILTAGEGVRVYHLNPGGSLAVSMAVDWDELTAF